MSFFKKLFGTTDSDASANAEGTETVRRIVDELEALPPERGRSVAAMAYILSRVANADLNISQDETREMERILREVGDLPEAQAILAVQIAKSQNRLAGSTENFLVTREFREHSSPEERLRLLHCLFEVSAADASISSAEEGQIRQIASELGFSLEQYVKVRQDYSEHRDVLKAHRRQGDR